MWCCCFSKRKLAAFAHFVVCAINIVSVQLYTSQLNIIICKYINVAFVLQVLLAVFIKKNHSWTYPSCFNFSCLIYETCVLQATEQNYGKTYPR